MAATATKHPRFDYVGRLRRSLEEETGERWTRSQAEVWLDRICDSFVHTWEEAGPEVAVREYPETARYLRGRWRGEEGRTLRRLLDELHPYWRWL